MELAQIGGKAPNLHISKWIQGGPTNIDNEVAKRNAVVVEVFQANCPGCFSHGLPRVLDIYNKYNGKGVTVLGVSTAFEDFDKNTIENTELLVKTRRVKGEALKRLGLMGIIRGRDKLPYNITIPVAFDEVINLKDVITDEKFDRALRNANPGFNALTDDEKERRIQKLRTYVEQERIPKTFTAYQLRGTPSTILIDNKGVLVETVFGDDAKLEDKVKKLIKR